MKRIPSTIDIRRWMAGGKRVCEKERERETHKGSRLTMMTTIMSAGRQPTQQEPLSVAGKARLKRELSMLQKDPPPGVTAWPVVLDEDHEKKNNNNNNQSMPRTGAVHAASKPQQQQQQQVSNLWNADIVGPEPFEDGIFRLELRFPFRYPFEPPDCRFVGPVVPYHPNIDGDSGRICLDTLKPQPAGSWSPAVSLPSLLLSLRSLLATPNPDDGLVLDISVLYKNEPEKWKAEARRRTKEQMEMVAGRDRLGKRAKNDASSRSVESNGTDPDPNSNNENKRRKTEEEEKNTTTINNHNHNNNKATALD